jgi:hypothetical protein
VAARWECPDCRRTFGRAHQGHLCSPALTLEDYLATAPDHERPVAEALVAHVATLAEAVVEPVSVGLLVKRRSTFVTARTMTRWVSISLKLPRVVTDPSPDRKVQQHAGAHHHVWNVRTPADLAPLLGLVDEAYEADA